MNLLKKCEKIEMIVLPTPDLEKVKEKIGEIDAIVVRANFPLRRELIDLAPNLRIISRVGAGLDNIDVEYAKNKGIKVLNVEGVNTLSVSEHTISLLLTLAKNLFEYDQEVRKGSWDIRYSYKTFEIYGKALGLIGFGLIGKEVGRIALALGMRVIFYDPFVDDSNSLPVEKISNLNNLLKESDFVSLHLPLNKNTKGMIGDNELRQMKPTAYLINVARGPIVVNESLYKALINKWIAGAGIDVFEHEPPTLDNPLLYLKNVILTPHVAGLTKECSEKVAIKAVDNLINSIEKN